MYHTAQQMEPPRPTIEAPSKSTWPVGLPLFESDTNQILKLSIIGLLAHHPITLNPHRSTQPPPLRYRLAGFTTHTLSANSIHRMLLISLRLRFWLLASSTISRLFLSMPLWFSTLGPIFTVLLPFSLLIYLQLWLFHWVARILAQKPGKYCMKRLYFGHTFTNISEPFAIWHKEER